MRHFSSPKLSNTRETSGTFKPQINFQGQRYFHRTNTKRGECNNHNQNQKEYKTILLSKAHKYVASIELNRPKAKNAFSLETSIEFVNALKALEEDSSVRCVVLSGYGPDFTSGVDIKSFMALYSQLQETEDPARKAKLLHGVVKKFQHPFKQMYKFPKPIICVQHGICYGLGMELAACSDIRYCSKDTTMSLREVLIGIAADVGSLQLMPKLVSNESYLRELIYTGMDLKADEALKLGFVNRVFETKQEAIDGALETAKLISSRSPVAVQGSKRNLRFSEDKPFNIGLDYNAIWNMSMVQSDDVVKAITAIMSKTDDVDYDDY